MIKPGVWVPGKLCGWEPWLVWALCLRLACYPSNWTLLRGHPDRQRMLSVLFRKTFPKWGLWVFEIRLFRQPLYLQGRFRSKTFRVQFLLCYAVLGPVGVCGSQWTGFGAITSQHAAFPIIVVVKSWRTRRADPFSLSAAVAEGLWTRGSSWGSVDSADLRSSWSKKNCLNVLCSSFFFPRCFRF